MAGDNIEHGDTGFQNRGMLRYKWLHCPESTRNTRFLTPIVLVSFPKGIKKGDGTSSKDFKTTKSRDQILDAFQDFTHGFSHVIVSYYYLILISAM